MVPCNGTIAVDVCTLFVTRLHQSVRKAVHTKSRTLELHRTLRKNSTVGHPEPHTPIYLHRPYYTSQNCLFAK
jgi:hypothetical protein